MTLQQLLSDRFNNPFVNHELMSISLNSTSKWKARNMPSFLEYINEKGEDSYLPGNEPCSYIAFYSNDIQRREDAAWYARDQKEMSTKYRTMHGHLTSTMHTKMTVQKNS